MGCPSKAKHGSGQMVHTDTVRAVDGTMAARRSVRAFLPDPVPHGTVADILQV